MNNNSSSLLDFLKRKSLFAESPTKNSRKKLKSNLRDSRSIEKRPNSNGFDEIADEEQTQPFEKVNPIFIDDKARNSANNYSSQHWSRHQAYPLKVAQNLQETKRRSRYNENLLINLKTSQVKKFATDNKLWSGLMTESGSFESARIQSKHCLQNLSIKISSEIDNINYKIESFKIQMKKTLNKELSMVREKIQQIFEAVFSESDKYIRDYIIHYEKKMAAQIIHLRNILEQQYLKIEKMREELNRPQWKKVAGEILSTELEDRISQLLRSSHQKDIQPWQFDTIEHHHIKDIQADLRQVIKLKY